MNGIEIAQSIDIRTVVAYAAFAALGGACVGVGVQIPAVRDVCTRAWRAPALRNAVASVLSVGAPSAIGVKS